MFTWSFTPDVYTSGPTGEVSFQATVDNTGTTDITRLTGVFSYLGTISPYYTNAVFGTTGNPSLYAEFAGIDLKPGDTFSFIFLTVGFANAQPGSYTGLTSDTLSLGDTSGGTGFISPTNVPLIDVVTPEPPALILVCTGALCLLGMAKLRALRNA